MVRVATPANEALLLDHARFMTAAQLEKLTRKYALVQRHAQDPHPTGDVQRRYVRRRDTEDRMVKIEAVLHPEEAELVWAMLDHAAKQLVRVSASSLESATSNAAKGSIAGSDVPAGDAAGAAATAAGAMGGSAPFNDLASVDSTGRDAGGDDAAESRTTKRNHAVTGSAPPQTVVGNSSDGTDDSAESRDVSAPTTEPTSGNGASGLHQPADAAESWTTKRNHQDYDSSCQQTRAADSSDETDDSAKSRNVSDPTSGNGASGVHRPADVAESQPASEIPHCYAASITAMSTSMDTTSSSGPISGRSSGTRMAGWCRGPNFQTLSASPHHLLGGRHPHDRLGRTDQAEASSSTRSRRRSGQGEVLSSGMSSSSGISSSSGGGTRPAWAHRSSSVTTVSSSNIRSPRT